MPERLNKRGAGTIGYDIPTKFNESQKTGPEVTTLNMKLIYFIFK
jgi:hypothetical protein